MQPKTSRFLKQVAKPLSRFLAAHPGMSKFLRKLPIVSGILDALEEPPQPQLTPTYNNRAKKRVPTLSL
ncbi:MAG: hypothetical protein ABI700_03865 [Chloroflexota bacterium]